MSSFLNRMAENGKQRTKRHRKKSAIKVKVRKLSDKNWFPSWKLVTLATFTLNKTWKKKSVTEKRFG